MLLSILFPIGLVLELGHLDGSDFLNLVVVDDKDLSVEGLVGEGSLGSSTGIWLLEADKSI